MPRTGEAAEERGALGAGDPDEEVRLARTQGARDGEQAARTAALRVLVVGQALVDGRVIDEGLESRGTSNDENAREGVGLPQRREQRRREDHVPDEGELADRDRARNVRPTRRHLGSPFVRPLRPARIPAWPRCHRLSPGRHGRGGTARHAARQALEIPRVLYLGHDQPPWYDPCAVIGGQQEVLSMPATRRLCRTTPVLAKRHALGLALLLILALLANGRQSAAQEPTPPRLHGEAAPISLAAIGAGELLERAPDGFRALPHLETRVRVRVAGPMVHGSLVQHFVNPGKQTIEALYVVPLPERATLHTLELRVGTRRIVAEVHERVEAARRYEAARQEGRRAALAESHAGNLVRLAVSHVGAGERVVVSLGYIEEARLEDGLFSHRLPLTFTPRFGAQAPAAIARQDAGTPFVPATDIAAPRVDFEARLDVGLPLARVESPTHPLAVRQEGPVVVATPQDGLLLADRDFELVWEPALERDSQGTLLTGEGPDGLYGLLIVAPHDVDEHGATGLPTETVFVLDVSGSMQGPSIEQARRALVRALERLRPGDSFEVLAFSDTLRAFGGSLRPAHEADEAIAWVRGLEADGGTELRPALERALALAERGFEQASRRVIFFTDGAVSAEDAVLARMTENAPGVRVHTLGIGNAPNGWLMREIARLGRGHAAFIADVDTVEDAMTRFLDRIERPLLAELELTWDGAEPNAVRPVLLPDLHAGTPLVVSFRADAGAPIAGVHLSGRGPDGPVELTLPARETRDGVALAQRWARAEIEAQLDRLRAGADESAVRSLVLPLALEHGILTRYTSLVAVEKQASFSAPGETRALPQALPSGFVGSGSLPRGGTFGPLMVRLGFLLVALGTAALVLPAWHERRRTRRTA